MTARIGSVLALIVLLATGCALTVINGSGNIVGEDRQVSGFDAVVLAGSGDLRLTQGEAEALTVTADDNLLRHIRTEVRGGTLHIEFDRDDWTTVYRPSQRIQYDLAVINLRALTLSGSGDISAPALSADRLSITVSGSGDARIDALQTEALTYVLSGSGAAELAGQAAAQDVTLSGSGNYRAPDLASATARVEISGSGDVVVWATETLDVSISGSGSAGYYGSPQVSSRVAGSGRVTSLGDK